MVHDELDLTPGIVRLKKGGGVAGHNGLKDIAARIGPDFWRMRIGIGHPGDRALVANYVLHTPREEEMPLISAAVERGLEVWPLIFAGEMEKAMHGCTRKPRPIHPPRTAPHEPEMRHRRPAQRRQVHPVQRADQGRHRGGELSLLHHRAQRRRGRGARPAARASWRRSPSRRR